MVADPRKAKKGRRLRCGKIKVAYVHAAAQEEVEKLKALIEERLTCAESLIAELSPALGVHTGPGTAGLCYFPVLESR